MRWRKRQPGDKELRSAEPSGGLGEFRTWKWRNQNALPCRLATPRQCRGRRRGLIENKKPQTLEELYALPQELQITRLIGIEGWSAIGKLATANALTAVQRKATMIAVIFEVRPGPPAGGTSTWRLPSCVAGRPGAHGRVHLGRAVPEPDRSRTSMLVAARSGATRRRWRAGATHDAAPRHAGARGASGVFDGLPAAADDVGNVLVRILLFLQEGRVVRLVGNLDILVFAIFRRDQNLPPALSASASSSETNSASGVSGTSTSCAATGASGARAPASDLPRGLTVTISTTEPHFGHTIGLLERS